MKNLLIVLLLIAGVGIGGYYATTGRLPWSEPSPEEQKLAALRAQFQNVRVQWKQAGRASISGMDTSTITDTPLIGLEKLEAALKELTPRLTSAEAKKQAGALAEEIAAFKSTMR